MGMLKNVLQTMCLTPTPSGLKTSFSQSAFTDMFELIPIQQFEYYRNFAISLVVVYNTAPLIQ
jgi:hypothetical protein